MTGAPVDHVAIVTGAAGGIGRAVAARLAASGASILAADHGTDIDGRGHDPSALEDLRASLAAQNADVEVSVGDGKLPGDAHDLVARALSRWGRLDTVVVAAGVRREVSALAWSDEDASDVLGLELLASLRLAAAAARAMRDGKCGGSITLMMSACGLFGAARQSLTAAASGGIVGFVRSASIEWKRHGVRVNAVAPTARTRQTETLPLFQSVRPDSMGPDAVANLVAFLASEAAAEVSGEVLGIAGPRIFALRSKESAGAFFDGETPEHGDIASRWRDIVR